jgi:hypothetical protein
VIELPMYIVGVIPNKKANRENFLKAIIE